MDLRSDAANCGACGNACAAVPASVCAPGTPAGRECRAGTCQADCSGKGVDCAGCCIDVKSDGRNCSHCGNVCVLGPHQKQTACHEGNCEVVECEDGFSNCTAEPGCETPGLCGAPESPDKQPAPKPEPAK